MAICTEEIFNSNNLLKTCFNYPEGYLKETRRSAIRDTIKRNMQSRTRIYHRPINRPIRLVWFSEIKKDVAFAQNKFIELIQQGYKAFIEKDNKLIRLREFDSELEEIIFRAPREADHDIIIEEPKQSLVKVFHSPLWNDDSKSVLKVTSS